MTEKILVNPGPTRLTGCVLYGYICSNLTLKGSVKINKANATFMSSLDKYFWIRQILLLDREKEAHIFDC